MAHTAEVDSWDYDDDYDNNADALEAMEVASLQELYDEPGTITIMSIDQLVDQLCQEGYHFGAPSELVGQQDTAESESHPCPKCGGPVTYLGFHMPGSYRAFVICNHCGHLAEF